MQAAVCLLSVVPMRKEPAHRSEMVSQILFGETVTIKDEQDGFVLLTCNYDGYTGWVQSSQLSPVAPGESLQTKVYTAGYTTPVTKGKSLLQIPYGCPVFGGDNFLFNVSGHQLTYLMLPQQTIHSAKQAMNAQTLEALCQPFINAPYLWGGKSVFGVDCSGFVQQVFKLAGKKLLRDAYLQAEEGEVVNFLDEARPGDLAFFCNEGGKVTHVGIIIDGNKIVHASGNVRIDSIDRDGIVHSGDGKRTHSMHSIRRYF